jgi:hypothetical protein
MTVNLRFFADVLGMTKSSSYWCPWCLMSCIEWQQSVESSSNTKQFDINFNQAELDLTISGGCPKVSIAAKSWEL